MWLRDISVRFCDRYTWIHVQSAASPEFVGSLLLRPYLLKVGRHQYTGQLGHRRCLAAEQIFVKALDCRIDRPIVAKKATEPEPGDIETMPDIASSQWIAEWVLAARAHSPDTPPDLP